MKRTSLLVSTFLLSGLIGVSQNNLSGGNNIVEPTYQLETAPAEKPYTNPGNNGALAAPGSVLLSENFGSGSIPSTWTVRTNSSHSGGWAWTNRMSQGQYAAGTDAIKSTTGSNGFMILDADLMNPGSSSTFTSVDAYVEIPVPNLTNINSLYLQFEHYWRPFSNAELLIEVSKNGTSWDTIDVGHGVPVNTTSSRYFYGTGQGGRPYIERVQLGKLIGGSTNAKIRFHWKGTSHYFWQVDDIKIVEGQYNDIDMVESYVALYSDTTYLNYGDYYSMIPARQANATDLQFSGQYENVGSRSQPNTQLNLLITGPNGFTATGTSPKALLNVGAYDSSSVSGGPFKLSNGVGDYEVNLFCTSDSTLFRTDADTIGYDIEVSDSTYARDNDQPTTGSSVYYNPTVVRKYEVGTMFEIQTIDTVSSVSFWLNSSNIKSPKLGRVTANIYRGGVMGRNNILTLGTAPIFSSKSYRIDSLNIPANGGWINLEVNRVGGGLDTILPGNYVVTFEADQYFGSDTVFLTLDGRDNHPGHYFLRQDQGSGYANWSLSSNGQYVRLNTTPQTCPLLNGSAVSKATTACGNTDGEVEAMDPTNGAAPYRYVWNISGNPTTKKVTGLGSGTYSVTITDANGCSQISSASVSDAGAPLIVGEAVKGVKCAGQGQGEVTINLQPGTSGPGYTFVWFDSNGDTVKQGAGATRVDSVLAGVESGMYSVEIYDSGTPPCKQSRNYTISGPSTPLDIPSSNVTTRDVECNGGSNGEIIITSVVGGSGTKTYAWSNGGTTTSISNLSAGTYTLTVTDDSSCTFTDSYSISEPTEVKIAVVGPAPTNTKLDSTSEANTYIIKPYVSGGTNNSGSYSYIWKNPNGDNCVVQSDGSLKIGPAHGPNQTGEVGSYCLEVLDDNGCKKSQCYEVSFFVSVETFGKDVRLAIFPNPSKGMVNVVMQNLDAGDYNIEVSNMVGQVVYSNEVNTSGDYTEAIDLTGNESGVYFVTISNTKGSASYKVIVE